MTVKRVIFIRSGETDWNRNGQFQGWLAIPLNEHGRQQAARLANFVRNIGVSALYSSDLMRARQVAELIGERLGYTPALDSRLRERDIGRWQGLTRAQMRAWYADDYQQAQTDPENYRVPGGESRADVRKRTLEAFSDIIAQDKGETIAIVSHTTAIHLLVEELIPGYTIGSADFGNTSVTTIVREADGWKLVATNDVGHLEGLAASAMEEVEK